MDAEDLETRLEAVERALTDGEAALDLAELEAAGDVESRLTDLETAVEALSEQLSELEAATQALRGYVGEARRDDETTDRRADAALTKAAAVERALEDAGIEVPDDPAVPPESAFEEAIAASTAAADAGDGEAEDATDRPTNRNATDPQAVASTTEAASAPAGRSDCTSSGGATGTGSQTPAEPRAADGSATDGGPDRDSEVTGARPDARPERRAAHATHTPASTDGRRSDAGGTPPVGGRSADPDRERCDACGRPNDGSLASMFDDGADPAAASDPLDRSGRTGPDGRGQVGATESHTRPDPTRSPATAPHAEPERRPERADPAGEPRDAAGSRAASSAAAVRATDGGGRPRNTPRRDASVSGDDHATRREDGWGSSGAAPGVGVDGDGARAPGGRQGRTSRRDGDRSFVDRLVDAL
jgi:hypothetical protein